MHKLDPAPAAALYIPALAYEALLRARNALFDAGIIPARRLPAPVISVGNITMGGSGKTPLVIHIAGMLSRIGVNPAILTRGYGRIRSSETHILAPEDKVFSPAWVLGDEPALMRRRLPSLWMGISGDRFAAGTALSERERHPVFLLDDGFQHRKLHRDLDIVVIDASQPLTENRVFPRGTLREPLRGLCRSDVIVINGSEDSGRAREMEIRKTGAGAAMLHCRQSIRSLIPFALWQSGQQAASAAALREGPQDRPPEIPACSYLVSALGNPERFRRDVLGLGIGVAGAKYFPDHYRLKKEDWQRCVDAARQSGAEALITTEKDAVKINRPPEFPLLVAVQSIEITEAGEFELLLKKTVEEHLR